MPTVRHPIRIGRHTLSVSNLDKPLYPDGFTKGQLIDYYTRMAPFMLPHLRGRPITFKRFPDGVDGPFFFEKTCNAYRPAWVRTATIRYGADASKVEHCILSTRADLAWAGNLAAIELHVSLATAARIQQPRAIVLDLDPGPDADLMDCIRAGLRLRQILEELSLQCFFKTSGGKGLHLYIPLNTPVTYEQTQPFARSLATFLADEDPDHITAIMAKSQRTGKVYVDWAQNMLHKTTVCVYSVRARPHPAVSTPVTIQELERAASRQSTAGLVFQTDDVLNRCERMGDLFEPMLKLKQRLPKLTPLDGQRGRTKVRSGRRAGTRRRSRR
jgi:bifunctional non-homologous end joining protein LigD